MTSIPKAKGELLEKMRFPLFTIWHDYLLYYKLAYEFVKKKGLSIEFETWVKTEGLKLVKTFYEEALEVIKETEN